MSKMTIVQDHNKEESLKYRRLLYVEFLELIARIAVQHFSDSELAEESLVFKVEHLLDDMLRFVDKERIV